jgi:hypothetical protein
MLDSSFEFRLTTSARRELTALADAIGVSAADVARIAIRELATKHLRKAKRAVPARPAALPAAPPSITTMELTALLALRDELAVRTSPEANREYTEINTEIIKREMRGAPR